MSQGAPNSEEVGRGKYLKFIIAETDYLDGDSYYTMYTGDELEIKVVQTDSVARDLSGITWDLEGVRLTPDRDNPTVLRFELNKSRSLNIEYHGTDNPAGYGSSDDYFYITNLSVPGSKPGTYLGAFHTIGAPGGVQCKY